jgi:general nucleoside transport system permease protein
MWHEEARVRLSLDTAMTIGRSDPVRLVLRIAASVAITLVLAGLVFQLAGADPFAAMRAVIEGSLGNRLGVEQTLMLSGILALAGLAFAIPARAQLWNIGGEGQIFAGALAAITVALKVSGLDPVAHTVLCLVAGALAGSLWAAIAGALKGIVGANEVLTTLMLNFIAVLLTDHAVSHWFPQEAAGNTTPPVPAGVRLPDVVPDTGLNVGVLLAVLSIVMAHILLSGTRLGLKIRAAGANANAARQNGVDVRRTWISAFIMGGACAGLAGAIVVVGVSGSLARDFSPGYGFIGIAVALLARSRPLWIAPAAVLFGILTVGGSYLEFTVGVSPSAALFVQGIFILLLLALWVLPPLRPRISG